MYAWVAHLAQWKDQVQCLAIIAKAILRDGGSTRVPATGPAVLSVAAIGMSQGQGLKTLDSENMQIHP